MAGEELARVTEEVVRPALRRRGHATQRRDRKIEVKVNDQELAQLRARAYAQGITVQRLMIRSVLAGSSLAADRAATLRRELVSAKTLLGRQGHLLNQQTAAMHATGELPPEVPHTLRSIAATIARIDALVERSGDVL